ncbi:MAG TPA: thiamine phosphate synthase [Syntrophales bacterium]|nr:thiamine phosphate synthase [Syntrophales bacterium]
MRGLYLVTDRGLCGNRSLEDVAHQALVGGAVCIQLREKDASTRFFVDEARKMKALTERFHVPLIINDRIDVALASGADGIHIGQDDMPYAEARRLMGPDAIIGLSVETWDDVVGAEALDVDYLGVSPIFETPTKTDTGENWGFAGLARIKAYSRHTLVAIGGMNAATAREAVMAGADAIAVVSAICAASDPLSVSREINEIIQVALKKRVA